MDNAKILLFNIGEDIRNTVETIRENDSTVVSYDKTVPFSKFIKKQSFDIVIMNIKQENTKDLDHLELLKKENQKRILPVILITNKMNNIPQVLQRFNSFSIDILIQPFPNELLVNKLNILLEHLQLESDLDDKITQLSKLNKQYKLVQEEIKSIAYYDHLTTIPNRRYMDLELSKQAKSCYRKKEPISILMIDLDNFKGFNDYYGHIAGDKVLQQVAEVIDNCALRPLDFAARYGGEEFVVILPNTDENGALKIAEQIRKNVFDLRIPHCPKCHFHFVTVSIGVYSTTLHKIEDTDILISFSDQAMYQAKKLGKNQSFIYKK